MNDEQPMYLVRARSRFTRGRHRIEWLTHYRDCVNARWGEWRASSIALSDLPACCASRGVPAGVPTTGDQRRSAPSQKG